MKQIFIFALLLSLQLFAVTTFESISQTPIPHPYEIVFSSGGNFTFLFRDQESPHLTIKSFTMDSNLYFSPVETIYENVDVASSEEYLWCEQKGEVFLLHIGSESYLFRNNTFIRIFSMTDLCIFNDDWIIYYDEVFNASNLFVTVVKMNLNNLEEEVLFEMVEIFNDHVKMFTLDNSRFAVIINENLYIFEVNETG
ncbi:MAG: hypothetical protein PHR06_01960, partial [Candidatus Cloacimonetes bacterium]|nr:hypothetical protein [Candidatus Cloacimonadota bacterium]